MGRFVWICEQIRNVLLWPLVVLFPRDRKKMVFGAWTGRNFSCNSKYFLLYVLRHHPEMHCVWIGNEAVRGLLAEVPGVRFVRKGSWGAFWQYLTAQYFVCNINWRPDIIDLPIFRRIIVINLFHGNPYKKIGDQQYFYRDQPRRQRRGLRGWLHDGLVRWGEYQFPQESWTSAPSDIVAKTFCEAFPNRYALSRMVVAGMPRNDYLVANAHNGALNAELKHKFAQQFGLPEDKRWYLYLPTFRYEQDDVYSFLTTANRAALEQVLKKQNAVIVEKQHPRVLQRLHVGPSATEYVFGLSESQGGQTDLQELLLASDRLITDYSSCFFDFSLLNRPVIHYAYDWESYCNQDTGVLYDLKDAGAGPMCQTEAELLAAIDESDAALLEKRGLLLDKIVEGEKGHASETLWEALSR